jgi:stage III sporulation protein SpoIIIAA
MRPRIKKASPEKINIQDVVLKIDRIREVYTVHLKDIMTSQGVNYAEAKKILSRRMLEKRLFKN